MKTIEEAALGYAVHRHIDVQELPYIGKYQAAFKAGVDFAQRWISVEEDNPPLGVPVICKYNVFGKEYYWSGTFYTEERVMHFIKKHLMITHWRLIEFK